MARICTTLGEDSFCIRKVSPPPGSLGISFLSRLIFVCGPIDILNSFVSPSLLNWLVANQRAIKFGWLTSSSRKNGL